GGGDVRTSTTLRFRTHHNPLRHSQSLVTPPPLGARDEHCASFFHKYPRPNDATPTLPPPVKHAWLKSTSSHANTDPNAGEHRCPHPKTRSSPSSRPPSSRPSPPTHLPAISAPSTAPSR